MSMGFGEIYRTILREYPDVLTVGELSRALGISSKTGYRLIREGKLAAKKYGASYIIRRENISWWLEQQKRFAES